METHGHGWRTLEEVARELRVPAEEVEKLVAAGEIGAVRVGGALRFHPSTVERLALRAERRGALRRWRRRALLAAGAAAAALACVVTLAVSPPHAGERVPRQLPYRGYLDLNGAPVTDPQTTMKFELFTVESGGTAAWSEEQSGISVLDGSFNVALGDVVPIPPGLFAQPSIYLAITVNGQALQGRQRLLTVPYAHYAAASSATPPGAVIAFAGAAVPPGWLACDGSLVEKAQHPALYAALGTTYGAETATHFRLPDYRGVFLRGLDAGAGRDPQPGRALGHYQEWATGMPRTAFFNDPTDVNHLHGYVDAYFSELWCQNANHGLLGANGNDRDNSRCETARTTAGADRSLLHGHGLRGGDAESRPNNVAVSWIIKAVD